MNLGANIGKLEKDWHHNKLDKTSLTSSDVGSSSVAHHGDIQLLGLLHITLVEELVEEEISPLGADLVGSQGCANVASVESDTGYKLLGNFDSFGG